MSGIAERLAEVKERISIAAQRADRADEVKLVAITKTVSPDRVLEAYRAGQVLFGENRVQEAAAKIESLCDEMPRAAWHLVGHLQRNKVGAAARLFSLVEAVDSQALAEKLNSAAARAQITLPVLVEVNVAGEATKGGFRVDEVRRAVSLIDAMTNLRLEGLMTVAPLAVDQEAVRWVFQRLRRLRDQLRVEVPALTQLSMGMSGDFEVAVQEGATMVRVGRAIFGERPAK